MLISIILIVVSLTLFFILKDRFDRSPPAFRYSVYVVLTLIIATLVTMEFFIYVHQRILEFQEAIKRVPSPVVWLVFLGLGYFTWRVLLLFGKFNRAEFQAYMHDTFVPKAKETFRDVAKTGKMGWQGLKMSFKNPFRKKDSSEDEKNPSGSP